jgi:BMFP domain-containing protein YqiC
MQLPCHDGQAAGSWIYGPEPGLLAPVWCEPAAPVRYHRAIGASVVEVTMSFMNSNGLDDLARRLADAVPESVRSFGRDLESNFKAVLQAQLGKLDLVTRQEFDVQAALLARTQASLSTLEARLKELEAKLNPQ